MNRKLTVECKFEVRRGAKGKKETRAVSGERKPVPEKVPRIAKLMALAIRFDELVRTGQVKDYAELGRLGRVSRARITQIMNLTCLSPEIQESILFLQRDDVGTRVLLGRLQSVATIASWRKQKIMPYSEAAT